MKSEALIKETLKYLNQKDSNNNPKYVFDIYDKSKDAPTPVRVYTVGELFDSFKNAADDTTSIIQNIGDLRSNLDNVKVSLQQLGYTSLNMTIDTLKAAIIPIETIQAVNTVYRIARPLAEKIADVASIMFHFSYTTLIAQDVLQYLKRIAVQTAQNYLMKLWEILLNTPVFAVYENTGKSINLAEAYSTISTEANKAINNIIESSFNEIVEYINSPSERRMNWPEYNDLGIVAPYTIIDIFHDYKTKAIIILCYDDRNKKSYIYSLNSDYSLKEEFSSSERIQKIYIYNEIIYYIVNDNTIKTISGYSRTISGATLSLIFSEPLLLYSGNKIYSATGDELTTAAGNILCTCYNTLEDVIYYAIKDGTKYYLYNITKDSNDQFSQEDLGVIDEPYGMAYFNSFIYILSKKNDKYNLVKVSGGLTFNKSYYNFLDLDINKDFIVYTNSEYSTDGNNIFKNSFEDLAYIGSTPNHINSIIKTTYKNKDYLISTGGVNIYTQPLRIIDDSGKIASNWNEKTIYNRDNETNYSPENIVGGTWFSGSYGESYLAYSHNSIMLFMGKNLESLLSSKEEIKEDSVLLYKTKGSFKDWYDEHGFNTDPNPLVECSYRLNLVDEYNDCIITSMRVVGDQIYVSIYNTKSSVGENGLRSGVYKVVVENSSLKIDYSNPVFTTDTIYKKYNPETKSFEKVRTDIKIYSFDHINNFWYYTDGKLLYNATNNFSVDLNLEKDEDRSIFLTKIKENEKEFAVIYSSKGILKSSENKNCEEISSNVNYSSSDIPQLTYTSNGVLYSDGEYVFNIIDTEGYKLPYELFQICYKNTYEDFRLIQSSDASFIVSNKTIKKIPLYSFITSSDYGCGYYTDTTMNKWYGAAPYYFSSNVLNSGKNNIQRDLYINSFRENFAVELEKLLKNVPNAFVNYTKNKLKKRLETLGVSVENDDGQITKLVIDSVSSNTANSIGMYIQQKFYDRIGDDYTYNTFVNSVYEACVADPTNNMTKDFYDIFESLYNSILEEVLPYPGVNDPELSNYLLRYYQNHKGEWADSMMSLINPDIVSPDIYGIPLNSTQTEYKRNYKFNYYENKYEFSYELSPSASRSDYYIINGYAKKDEQGNVEGFYEDEDETELIDYRIRDANNNYYDIDGNVICYYNLNDGNFYKYLIEDYIISEDTEEIPGKIYYKKIGDNNYIYSLTEDESVITGKDYFERMYIQTQDTTKIEDKKYFEKKGGDVEYIPAEPVEGETYLPIEDSYFEKINFSLTTDTTVDNTKTYYVFSYIPVSSPYSEDIQYYKKEFIPTTDTIIDTNKTYFEKIDYSDYINNSEPIYKYVGAGNGNFKLIYVDASEINSEETYYIKDGDNYVLATDVSIQGGPYYTVNGLEEVGEGNGDYIESTDYSQEYAEVLNPSLENLRTYYEYDFKEIATPEAEASDVYTKDYVIVVNPNDVDIIDYYEKSEEGKFIESKDINYVYSDGEKIGVVKDRNYYIQVCNPETFEEVSGEIPNPAESGLYEYGYALANSIDISNPKTEGYYERSFNGVRFEVAIFSTQETMYECTKSYSTLFEDKKIYIDLAPISQDGVFDVEDEKWHEVFYNYVDEAWDRIKDEEDLQVLKAKALTELSTIQRVIYPSWVWQEIIKSSVTEYYIPTQYEQYKSIIMESNMYPIQWNELPSNINKKTFDYALTALLYEIKQRLITNISILVNDGKVKCYSCVDASSVIRKMVERNGVIWSNQIRSARNGITKASEKEEIESLFINMSKTYDDSRYMLKNILDQQSKLYASYIDKIITEQVINDNDTEVVLND